jgi:hypothetical protein
MGTTTRQEHEQRSRELADSLRNFLVAVNTGGIGALLLAATSLAEQKMNPSWAMWPMLIFVFGLLCTAWSIFAAQHRAEERWKATNADRDLPYNFPRYWQSAPWNIAALICFVVGAVLSVLMLSCLQLG